MKYLRFLDGFRGISILLVMFYHIFYIESPKSILETFFYKVASIGWLGVDVFFVISGFLITSILISKEINLRKFYKRRIFRIFPIYYILLTTVLIAFLINSHFSLGISGFNSVQLDGFIYNYLYISNFATVVYGSNFVPMDIAWSLAIEEQFYIIFPFIILFFGYKKLHFIPKLILLLPFVRYGSYLLFEGNYLAPYMLTFCRLDGILLGSYIAVLKKDNNFKENSTILRMSKNHHLFWVASILFALFFDRNNIAWITIGYSLVPISTSLTLVALINNLASRKFLENEILVRIGKLSYGLYLYHILVRDVLNELNIFNFSESQLLDALLFTALCMSISYIVSRISFTLIEQRFLKWSR